MSILAFISVILSGADIVLNGFIGIYQLVLAIVICALIISVLCCSCVKSKTYLWHVVVSKVVLFIILLVCSYAKMLALGNSENSLWKWFSVIIAILAIISLLIHEIFYLKNSLPKLNPNKTNSFDVSPKKTLWAAPKEKASTLEIKHTEKKIDTEKENLIRKIESFKQVKILYILRNDLDVLPLPGEPLKRFSSHNSLDYATDVDAQSKGNNEGLDIHMKELNDQRHNSNIFDCLKVRRDRILRESMESPKFNSIKSRESSMNPNGSKDEALDYATSQYNMHRNDMFRKRVPMFSFDGDNTSSIKSKESSKKTTSKKSSENSLISNKTVDLPNTPNFNPTWKKQSTTSKSRRRNAHFYQKAYFKKLSEIMEETGEEVKEEDSLIKKINRESTLRVINEICESNSALGAHQEEGISSCSLSDLTSNDNTNLDQGSATDISQKLSISSNKQSRQKESSLTPSDQSKISSTKKKKSTHTPDNSNVPLTKETSDVVAPYFPNPSSNHDDAQSQAKPLDKTSKSVPVIKTDIKRISNAVKYDSVLNIQANISEKSGDGAYNPFKSNYRQSKTSEEF
ncbi:unnamed protein product [Moneuplotes crassus]|uniref:Uncharacterized protein n=1 Tax=Euplotes crassus TaxID=5936 RepID=A0AAD1U685_EUPCR|nr:unnamed protein product [Moneuplotes crassus]